MLIRKLATFFVGTGVTLSCMTATAFAAGNGYAPGASVGTSNAGGGTLSVVTSQTVSSTGGTLQATDSSTAIQLIVPSGAFSQPEQITISTGNTTSVTGTPSGTTAVGDYNISFSGSAPSQPITLVLKNSSFTSQALVYKATPSGLVKVNATAKAGEVDISFSTDPEFVVAQPKSSTVAGATSPTTGLPFDNWLLVAGVLVVLGAALVAVARRKVK